MHNKQYHRTQEPFGYSRPEQLPVNAPKWIAASLAIIRAKLKQCRLNPVGCDSVVAGKPGAKSVPKKSAFERIISSNLGEYPGEYVHMHGGKPTPTTENRVTSLLSRFAKADKNMKTQEPTASFMKMQELLRTYSLSSMDDSVFPFSNNKVFGLSVDKMRHAFRNVRE